MNSVPRPIPPLSDKDIARFWSKVRIAGPDDCWEWQARSISDGYGYLTISFGGGCQPARRFRAHRLSWVIANGPIPDALGILHKCDNRLCVNPIHLFTGTHRDNMEDMVSKGRSATGDRNAARLFPERRARGLKHGSHTKPHTLRRGSSNGNSHLTEEKVAVIRRRYCAGEASQRKLAEEFSLSINWVNQIVRGLVWKHIL
jgi:hypothetical protein